MTRYPLSKTQVSVLSDELQKQFHSYEADPLKSYFGTLRSSFMSQRAALSSAKEPDW